jgi:hypothetical protein
VPFGDLEEATARPPSENSRPSEAQRAELAVAASGKGLVEGGFPDPGGGAAASTCCAVNPYAAGGMASRQEGRNGKDCRECSHCASAQSVHEVRRLVRPQDVTTGVAADDAEADPATFVAVTTTRIVLPISLDVSTLRRGGRTANPARPTAAS